MTILPVKCIEVIPCAKCFSYRSHLFHHSLNSQLGGDINEAQRGSVSSSPARKWSEKYKFTPVSL